MVASSHPLCQRNRRCKPGQTILQICTWVITPPTYLRLACKIKYTVSKICDGIWVPAPPFTHTKKNSESWETGIIRRRRIKKKKIKEEEANKSLLLNMGWVHDFRFSPLAPSLFLSSVSLYSLSNLVNFNEALKWATELFQPLLEPFFFFKVWIYIIQVYYCFAFWDLCISD